MCHPPLPRKEWRDPSVLPATAHLAKMKRQQQRQSQTRANVDRHQQSARSWCGVVRSTGGEPGAAGALGLHPGEGPTWAGWQACAGNRGASPPIPLLVSTGAPALCVCISFTLKAVPPMERPHGPALGSVALPPPVLTQPHCIQVETEARGCKGQIPARSASQARVLTTAPSSFLLVSREKPDHAPASP